MNASEIFDSVLALGFFLLAIIILAAVAGIVDSIMDPECNCAEIRRQKNETRGVAQ